MLQTVPGRWQLQILARTSTTLNFLRSLRECHSGTSKQTMTASFHIPSTSFINHPTIQCCMLLSELLAVFLNKLYIKWNTFNNVPNYKSLTWEQYHNEYMFSYTGLCCSYTHSIKTVTREVILTEINTVYVF